MQKSQQDTQRNLLHSSIRKAPLWLGIPLAAGFALSSFQNSMPAALTSASNLGVQDPDEAPEPIIQDFEVADHQESDHGADKENHEKMEAAMKGLRKNQKALRGLIADPAANQKLIWRHLVAMEGHVLEAYNLIPPRPEQKMTEAEWSLFRLDYKKQMLSLQSNLLDMQGFTLRADKDKLVAGYKALNEDKKQGHDKFQPDDEE